MILEPLEERIVLDAAVSAQIQATVDDHQHVEGGQEASVPHGGDAGGAVSEASQGVEDPGGLQHVYGQDLHEVLISNALDDIQTLSASDPNESPETVRVLVVSSALEAQIGWRVPHSQVC